MGLETRNEIVDQRLEGGLLAGGVVTPEGVPGDALLGSRLTGRLPEPRLKQAIAAILVVAGVATLVQAIV